MGGLSVSLSVDRPALLEPVLRPSPALVSVLPPLSLMTVTTPSAIGSTFSVEAPPLPELPLLALETGERPNSSLTHSGEPPPEVVLSETPSNLTVPLSPPHTATPSPQPP